MKKILIAVFTMLASGVFAQALKTNGIIYKEHPYITIVNSTFGLFLKQDWEGLGKLYADSAKFNDPAFPKSKNWAEAKKAWTNLFNDWKNITITRQKGSYPDGFEFDNDGFQV